MTNELLNEWKKEKIVEDGDIVLAGVSGGADSVCLLLMLEQLQKKTDFLLEAVHVEHDKFFCRSWKWKMLCPLPFLPVSLVVFLLLENARIRGDKPAIVRYLYGKAVSLHYLNVRGRDYAINPYGTQVRGLFQEGAGYIAEYVQCP